jgi:NAD(P)-dependent dehydrogenase (short-subunit alcohol dehydrogenase family)
MPRFLEPFEEPARRPNPGRHGPERSGTKARQIRPTPPTRLAAGPARPPIIQIIRDLLDAHREPVRSADSVGPDERPRHPDLPEAGASRRPPDARSRSETGHVPITGRARVRDGVPLDGRRVIITGASRGIGAECAIACAAAGAAAVVLIARSEPRLTKVAQQIRAAGGHAVVHPCDVTDTAALRSAIAACSPADVLVNCAGGNQPEPLLDVTPETFERLWRLNVQSVYFASQAAAQHMIAQGRPGVIVNVSSQMGHVGAPRRSVYCATKHAVEGLTQALGAELGPHDIRVVSVAPTFVHTEMTAAQLDDPTVGPELRSKIPLGRFATTEQVASTVVYAASDAAGSLTGTSIVIDGGWTAQ